MAVKTKISFNPFTGNFDRTVDTTDLDTALSSIQNISIYEIITFTASATGAVVIPTNATIDTGHFTSPGRVILSEVSGGEPTGVSPRNGQGDLITGTIDSLGNITLSENYTGDLAIVYGIDITLEDYSTLASTVLDRIVDETDGSDIETTLADVATSGDYDDLSNTPQNLSDFNNDEGFITNNTTSSFSVNTNGTLTHNNGNGSIVNTNTGQELHITNTDITTNLAPLGLVAFSELFGNIENDDPLVYSVNPATAEITFLQAGRYRFFGEWDMVGGNGNNAVRNNIRFPFYSGSTQISPNRQGNYLRDGGGHNEVSEGVAGWRYTASANETIQLRRQRIAGSGGTQTLQGTNNFLTVIKVR